LLAALLTLPAFAPLLGHYIGFALADLRPTGFIIYDTPYYVANAREHFDGARFSLLYSNPFSYDYASPRIYFQPLTLFLGIVLRITRADPGLVFALTGVLTALICARMAIALFDRFADRSEEGGNLALLAFVWGGGIFVVTGTLFAALVKSPGVTAPFDSTLWWWFIRVADPAGGWWFLNLGRNLVLPTEAFYHALFFGAVVMIVSRRFVAAFAFMAALSMSHPFTGLQLLGIVVAWAGIEVVLLRNRSVPAAFAAASVALLIAHIVYYLVFLPSFPEHRQLQLQWTLDWTVDLPQALFAYSFVGLVALWTVRSRTRLRAVVTDPTKRLLIVWFVVSIALENHEQFVKHPVQPIHFTRGYVWVALFLLGVPTLAAAFRRAYHSPRAPTLVVGAATVFVLALADNSVWLGATAAQGLGLPLEPQSAAGPVRLGYGLTAEQTHLLAWLHGADYPNSVVVSEDLDLGYLVTVYTPFRSWRSHYANTPWNQSRLNELRQFFQTGVVNDGWKPLPLLIVFRNAPGWKTKMIGFGIPTADVVYENKGYVVVRKPRLGNLPSPTVSSAIERALAPGVRPPSTRLH